METKQQRYKWMKIVALLLVTIGLGVSVLSVTIPLNMSDGLENYSGVEREVAQDLLFEFGYPWDGIDRISHLGDIKYRVELVKNVDRSQFCTENEKPGILSKGDYLVVIARRTFFGIRDNLIAHTPCGTRYGDEAEKLLREYGN